MTVSESDRATRAVVGHVPLLTSAVSAGRGSRLAPEAVELTAKPGYDLRAGAGALVLRMNLAEMTVAILWRS